MYLDKCNDKNNNKYNNENNNKCTNKIIQNFIIIFQLLKKINATRTTRFLNKHFKCLLPYYLYIFLKLYILKFLPKILNKSKSFGTRVVIRDITKHKTIE